MRGYSKNSRVIIKERPLLQLEHPRVQNTAAQKTRPTGKRVIICDKKLGMG